MYEEELIQLCKKYKIENYVINPDMSIDVNGSVEIYTRGLNKIPLRFNKITEYFYCDVNNMTTLEGCPNYVGSSFDCSSNDLTTLKDLPMNFYIGDDFRCYNNKITSPLEYSRLFFGYIGGEIKTDYDNLDKFLNKHKNPPKKDLPKLLSELRKIQL